MRGNHHDQHRHSAVDTRSIPARAGEPPWFPSPSWPDTVYPRACGGTGNAITLSTGEEGLSPRVRGNRQLVALGLLMQRSIPARAGEPPPASIRAFPSPVYPRACGGTTMSSNRLHDGSGGLSPRVRGNHTKQVGKERTMRSIPARAGEPGWLSARIRHSTVYPRACGGTRLNSVCGKRPDGLSPRVRGNRNRVDQQGWCEGSIPARAGEPPYAPQTTPATTVYPRACGGTARECQYGEWLPGLSPRVRGNPRHLGHRADLIGSIPARAGEPRPDDSGGLTHGVYPRACGGTASQFLPPSSHCGLSPRVRGNLTVGTAGTISRRSIPARAGEPL